VCGTTGESPTLSVQEKLALFRKTRAVLPQSVRMMAGTGGSNTAQCLELSKLAVDSGADSLLIVTPPYNKPSPLGLTQHFTAIASAAKVPICLYHVPGRTAQLLSPSLLAEICNTASIAAVKEASGDMALFSRLVTKTKAAVLTGDDPTFLASLAIGGKGVISVISNVYPKLAVALWRAFSAGKKDEALALHNHILPMIDALFCEANPGPVKYILSSMGLIENQLRLPMAPVIESSVAQIREAMRLIGEDRESI